MRIIRIKNPLCKMSSNGGGRHWAPFCCGRFRSLVLSFISLKHLAMLIVFISIITVVTKVTMRKSHGDAYSSVELKSLGLPDFKPLSRGARNVVNIYTIFNTSSFRHFANVKDVPSVHVPEVSCARLFEGDSVELAKAESYHGTYKTNQRNIDVVKLKNTAFVSCKKLKRDRQYLVKPINAEEEEFPLAFSILMYRDAGQTERLLRAIYRPQNYYCIHVDQKSQKVVHEAMRNLAKCFDNVVIASKSYNVTWGDITVVKAETQCMSDLIKFQGWKYYLSLTGQEFPLRSNLELVRIMKMYGGQNDIPGVPAARAPDKYWDRVKKPRIEGVPREKRPTKNDFHTPVNISFGSAHMTASRDFVGFVLNQTVARELKAWLSDTRIPDETFYSTLHHSATLGFPGHYTGDPARGGESANRYKMWRPEEPCGRHERRVCIMGLVNLPTIKDSKQLFVNKFFHDYHPLALDCAEELIHNRTRYDIRGFKEFDSSYYKNLGFMQPAPPGAVGVPPAPGVVDKAPVAPAAKKPAKPKQPNVAADRPSPKQDKEPQQQQQKPAAPAKKQPAKTNKVKVKKAKPNVKVNEKK